MTAFFIKSQRQLYLPKNAFIWIIPLQLLNWEKFLVSTELYKPPSFFFRYSNIILFSYMSFNPNDYVSPYITLEEVL